MQNYPLLKNLPIIPLATFPAIPPEYSALPAIFDACPNLSHLEKASVFVIVRLSAITIQIVSIPVSTDLLSLTPTHAPHYPSQKGFMTYQQESTK
jgi:hypothetical protein